MKHKVSLPAAVVVIVSLVVVYVLMLNRATGPAPGLDPDEAAKHTGLQAIQDAKASGPPPGRPLPSYPTREEMTLKKGH